jgi:hypothetical protein
VGYYDRHQSLQNSTVAKLSKATALGRKWNVAHFKLRDVRLNNLRINDKTSDTVLSPARQGVTRM